MNLIEIFNKGMQNDACLGAYQGWKQKVQIGLFLVITLFLSRYRAVAEPDMVWINGNRGYEKNFTRDDQYLVFHGSAFKKLSNYSSLNSIMSCQSFSERIGIFIRALKTFHGNKEKIKMLSYWIEFSYIESLIRKSKAETILTTSIYDRQITWISYLADELDIQVIIYQHGVIADETIPHKIICSKMFVINNSQVANIRKNIIENDDCTYEISKLKSVVDFTCYPDTTLPLIGIATQRNPVVMDGIVNSLLRLEAEFRLILLLHPLEKNNAYRQYLHDKRVIIEPRNKYINLDVLITQHSTIVYDYIQNDFEGQIVQIDPGGSICALDGVEGILRFNEYDDMAESVNKIIKRERKRG